MAENRSIGQTRRQLKRTEKNVASDSRRRGRLGGLRGRVNAPRRLTGAVRSLLHDRTLLEGDVKFCEWQTMHGTRTVLFDGCKAMFRGPLPRVIRN